VVSDGCGEGSCEKEASSFFKYIDYSYPDQPEWDLKSHLEGLRFRARRFAAGRVPDGVSEEGFGGGPFPMCEARSVVAGNAAGIGSCQSQHPEHATTDAELYGISNRKRSRLMSSPKIPDRASSEPS
jgi:hypothetical protein